MRMFGTKPTEDSGWSVCGEWKAMPLVTLFLLILFHGARSMRAQADGHESVAQRIQQLSDAMAKTQAQVDESQRELDQMREELRALKQQMAQGNASPAPAAAAQDPAPVPPQSASDSNDTAVQDLRERIAIAESEIATHDQSKVESESKYPVKITGLVLMNGFFNSGAVDFAATPTLAVGGSGSGGASIRQTILGLDAWGPHLFGARSFADLRMDFYGSPGAEFYGSPSTSSTSATYSGYYIPNFGLLRLRTAHAGLDWDRVQAYFSLDRPILNPDTPTSLTATAVPALAWSGNLWTWNPQAGITANLAPVNARGVQFQAALIDVGDAPLTPQVAPDSSSSAIPPSSAEQSQKPGVESRFAWLGPNGEEGRDQLGVGGYFAAHQSSLGRSYDSWAATVDARLLLPARLQFTGSGYRGLALGGLGGGGYKDFAWSPNPVGGYYFRALDDAGGWAQLKEKVSERLEFNGAIGMDNVFASDLQLYYVEDAPMIVNLARNRTVTGNVIYSPSSYLLFSLEYRRLESYPIQGSPAESNIIGIGAGYKF
jgi:hypothetical protein